MPDSIYSEIKGNFINDIVCQPKVIYVGDKNEKELKREIVELPKFHV